jgi:pimeloyl-ACP methyl ester carboxylesterase
LVVAGDQDPTVPLRDARVLAGRLRDSRVHVVKGGGHLFLLDEPESVVGTVRAFVDDG